MLFVFNVLCVQCSLCAMFIVYNVHCVQYLLCAMFIVCSELCAAKHLEDRLTLPVQLMHEISAGQGSVLEGGEIVPWYFWNMYLNKYFRKIKL